jgi:outer membrane receptor protein involved in Fe transport
MRLINKNASCALLISAIALGGSAVRAQVTVNSQNGSEDKLEEIVVTAEKRTENLQNVPISVQVISGQTLSEKNFNSLDSLTETTPGVHVSSGGSTSQLFIRGIGSGDLPAFDQSVAVFNDDIYNGRSRQSGATFLDLARIEVLKGPQSTFFGNSAIAGALNIVTQRPGDTFDAIGRVLYGQWGQYAGEAAVTLPVSDTLSMRLAVMRNGQGGWITNVNTGQKAPDENNEAARLTVLFKPIENLDATFKVEGSRNKTLGTVANLPYQRVNCPPPAPIAPGFAGDCGVALTLGGTVPLGLGNDENSGLAGQGSSLATYDAVLTVNYQYRAHTFTSVTGFTNYNFESQDSQVLPVPYEQISSPESYHQFSQEFRVASPTDQTFTYLAGAYFQSDQLGDGIAGTLNYLDFVASIPGFGALTPYLPFAIATPFDQHEDVYAVFGALGWNVTDQLRFDAGLRATRVVKEASGSDLYGTTNQIYGGFTSIPPAISSLWQLLSFQGVGGPSPPVSNTYHGVTPSAGIQYQFNPEAMAYFSYHKGFKAGGFNGQQLVAYPSLAAYGPEHVDAYELGFKSKWINDTLLVNVDLFRSDYKDLQVSQPFYVPELNTYEDKVTNAAASRAQGIELEAQWAATHELRFSANVTYLDSTYTSFPDSSPPVLQNSCASNYVVPGCSQFSRPVSPTANITGQSTPYSPKWSESLTASYALALPANYSLTTRLSPYISSAYYSDGANGDDPFYRVGGYMRLDASMTLEVPSGRWAVDLIGKNLTDHIIVSTTSLNQAAKEEPLNVAVQLRAKF